MTDSAAPALALSWEEHHVLSHIAHGTAQGPAPAAILSRLATAGLVEQRDGAHVATEVGVALATPKERHR